eukprot:tig00000492_g1397.t1
MQLRALLSHADHLRQLAGEGGGGMTVGLVERCHLSSQEVFAEYWHGRGDLSGPERDLLREATAALAPHDPRGKRASAAGRRQPGPPPPRRPALSRVSLHGMSSSSRQQLLRPQSAPAPRGARGSHAHAGGGPAPPLRSGRYAPRGGAGGGRPPHPPHYIEEYDEEDIEGDEDGDDDDDTSSIGGSDLADAFLGDFFEHVLTSSKGPVSAATAWAADDWARGLADYLAEAGTEAGIDEVVAVAELIEKSKGVACYIGAMYAGFVKEVNGGGGAPKPAQSQ